VRISRFYADNSAYDVAGDEGVATNPQESVPGAKPFMLHECVHKVSLGF